MTKTTHNTSDSGLWSRVSGQRTSVEEWEVLVTPLAPVEFKYQFEHRQVEREAGSDWPQSLEAIEPNYSTEDITTQDIMRAIASSRPLDRLWGEADKGVYSMEDGEAPDEAT